MIIKICGIRDLATARVAVEHGADLLGFMFYPPSPRYIEPAAATAIIAELPPSVEAVGVFVNETAAHMQTIAQECGLAVVQLHGAEPPAIIAELQTSCKVMKAIALKETADLALAERYPGIPLVVDTPCLEWGGSGKTGDWQLARQLASQRDILLAGGLTPENVAAAVKAVQPAGIDVSSGVEHRRGDKDPTLIRQFLAAARNIHEESE